MALALKNICVAPEQTVTSFLINEDLVTKELCRRSLSCFVQYFWDTIIQDELEWNWHMTLLCQEIEKVIFNVIAGRTKLYDLVINIPPGTTKSTIVSQMAVAWSWIAALPEKGFETEHKRHRLRNGIKKDQPYTLTGGFLRYISMSYSGTLSLEHADYTRDVIRSEKFKTLFKDEIVLRQDKDQKSNYRNNQKGGRFSTSTRATATGLHAHVILIDDPLNPEQAVSEKDRVTATRVIRGTLSTRKVSKKVTATILIMQRLDIEDPTKYFLDQGNVRHICLPGECRNYEVKPAYLRKYYIDGLLEPNRLSQKELDALRKALGPNGYDAQVGQKPNPRGGQMFETDKFEILAVAPPVTQVKKIVRYWDKAATEDGGCNTCGVKMALMYNGSFVIFDVKKGQWGTVRRERIIRQTAILDGRKPTVWMEQEPGSAGKDSVTFSIKGLAGYKARADKVTGNKETRAIPYADQVNIGNVFLVKGEWNKDFIEEHATAPSGAFKDQWDAASGAFNRLTAGRKKAGALR